MAAEESEQSQIDQTHQRISEGMEAARIAAHEGDVVAVGQAVGNLLLSVWPDGQAGQDLLWEATEQRVIDDAVTNPQEQDLWGILRGVLLSLRQGRVLIVNLDQLDVLPPGETPGSLP